MIMFTVVGRIVAPSQTMYGETLILRCESIELPSKYASRLHIEWLGPNGRDLSRTDGIITGPLEVDGHSSSRTLQFDFLRASMDGVYICQLTIDNETYTKSVEYDLQVIGKCVILKSAWFRYKTLLFYTFERKT